MNKYPYHFTDDNLWFDVNEDQIRVNPYSGIEIVLNGAEATFYDFLMSAYKCGHYETFKEGKEWFMQNNIHAYMYLID